MAHSESTRPIDLREYRDLTVEREGAVATLTFSRSSVLNAFRERTFAECAAALDGFSRDGSLRVVVLTGAGRAFCSGQDLGELLAAEPEDFGPGVEWRAREGLAGFQSLTRALLALPQVVIAAINGPAVGLGAELALAADVRVIATGAYVAFQEARWGLFPTNGTTYLLPKIVGRGRAADLLLSARKAYPRELEAAGFVSRVLDPETLLPEARSLARSIADNSPQSVQLIKAHFREAEAADLERALSAEVDAMVTCLRGPDLWIGLRAFEAGQKPVFDAE